MYRSDQRSTTITARVQQRTERRGREQFALVLNNPDTTTSHQFGVFLINFPRYQYSKKRNLSNIRESERSLTAMMHGGPQKSTRLLAQKSRTSEV